MIFKFAPFLPFAIASPVGESSISGMLTAPVALGTPPQDISLTIDFSAFESSVFVDGAYGRNCYAFVNCFRPTRSSTFSLRSRKVSFFSTDSSIRTGSVAIDSLMFGSDDEQKVEFLFNSMDRSDPASSSVPRDSAGYVGLNPRGHFARSNLVVFDSSEDGSYELSVLPKSKLSDMFSADHHTSVIIDTFLNDQINEWIVPVRIVPVRASRNPQPVDPKPVIDMIIDLNEQGIVIHQSLQSVFLDLMFSSQNDYLIHQSWLYTKCDITGGLFGIGVGGRFIEWSVAGLWFHQPNQQVTRHGHYFCKTKVSFTTNRVMTGKMRIGKMLMQHVSTLVLAAAEKRVFMEFVTPKKSAYGRSVFRLNPIRDPSPFVRTFDWPSVEESIDSLVFLTFPTHPKGNGEWCLFTPHARFIGDVQKVLFYRCDSRRLRRATLRHMKLKWSDLNIDEFFRLRDDELQDDSDNLVFAAPRDNESRGTIEITETEHTMEIVLRYGEASETDRDSTEHETESDPPSGSDSDSCESGKKRSGCFEDIGSTSNEDGIDEKRSRLLDEVEVD